MKLEDVPFSHYGLTSCTPSPVNRMMASFAAEFRQDTDINLGVGYVNERTIPRTLIVEAMDAVLNNPAKYKAALNYGGPRGSANLVASLKRFLVENNIGALTEEILAQKEIIIGPSGATSLLDGIAQVVKPGIVITHDPMYYIYCNYLERMGFEVVTVPEDHDGMIIERVAEKLKKLGPRKKDVRFFYAVTVNNPTGTIIANDRVRQLIHTARGLSVQQQRKVPVILDSAYADLVHDETVEPFTSGLACDDAGLVYELGTLSKILSPALRVGYMMGSDGPFMRAMIQKTSDVGFSAPLITQEIASYLLDHHVKGQINRVKAGYRDKARTIRQWIEGQLGEYLDDYTGGKAGFYFYLTFKDIHTTEQSPFFNYLARTTGDPDIDGPENNKKPRVIYVPGQFCVHPRGELVETGKRQLRLSYGFEETERIERAIMVMREAAAYAHTTTGKN